MLDSVAGVRVVEDSIDVEDCVDVEDSIVEDSIVEDSVVEDSVVESRVAEDRDEEDTVVEDGEEDGEIDVTFTETLAIQPQESSNAIHISKVYFRNKLLKVHETHRATQLE